MIPPNKRRLIGLILLLFVLLWFSTRKGEDLSDGQYDSGQSEKAKTPSSVIIQTVDLIPASPHPNSTIRVKVKTNLQSDDPPSYRYLWRVNNQEVSRESSLSPGRFHEGDTVSVEVTPVNEQEGLPDAAPFITSVKIGNNAPVIESIKLLPIPVAPGQEVVAEVAATDQDGDFVQLSYEWQVNGKPVNGNNRRILSGDQVHSADRILVFVTPSDPYSKGEVRVSPLITVLNRPPEIVSLPPNNDDKGRYVYQIVAKDPDMDTMNYILLEGPPGMEVDSTNGLVHWDLSASLSESQSDVAIEVNDGKGGKTIQRFTLKTTPPRAK